MAEQYVSREQFGEFVQRMEDRFDHVGQRFDQISERFGDAEKRADDRFYSLEKRMEQGFAYLEKARAEDAAHTDQRFDALEKRMAEGFAQIHAQMTDFRAEMRQMRGWLFRLYGLVVFGFIGGIVLILFRDFIFK